MAYTTSVICEKCKKKTDFIWKRGIKYICSNCHHEIDFCYACLDGRVTTNEGVCSNIWGGKKKKGK